MNDAAELRVAVVTGGHPFDVPHFQTLFNLMDGIQPFFQHMEDFASASVETRDAYHAVVYYHMLTETPGNEERPWYAGDARSALERMGETAQGIVMLHHALLAYPEWAFWNSLIGIGQRRFDYFAGETVPVTIVNRKHPITVGLTDWTMTDEAYRMNDPSVETGSDILLSVDHPKSMKHIAWTRAHKGARVFCFQSGHDKTTWSDPYFREVLRRGIRWSARAI